MDLDEAKARLNSLYALIGNLASEDKIGKGVSSPVILDGSKIILAEPNKIDSETAPLMEEFLIKHTKLWQSFIGKNWQENDARELVTFEKSLWDNHFS